jgi:hypothetical protein
LQAVVRRPAKTLAKRYGAASVQAVEMVVSLVVVLD